MSLDSDLSSILSGSPQRVKTAAAEVEARSASDAILLDQHSAQKSANASNPLFGLRVVKQITPGALGQSSDGVTDEDFGTI